MSAQDMIDEANEIARQRWIAERDVERNSLISSSSSTPAEAVPNGTEPSPGDEAPASLRDRLLTIDQLGQLPPPRPLVAGVLDVDNTSITYGRRGAYKSFLALDMGLSIASGIDWHGHATTPGVVVYVVAEGVSGVHQRIDAWLACHRFAEPGERLLILPEPVNLLAPAQVHAFALGCYEVGAVFVVLDTLARCLVGGDENSARDMGIAVASLDTIRRATGANVNAVHHAGKDSRAGARGSSALEAGVETVLEVGASDDIVTVRTTKQKNRPEGSPIMFDVTPSASSIVLVRRHRPDHEVTDKTREALAILDAIAGGIGSTFTPWVDACDEAGISKTTVRRVRVKALDEGWIGHGPNSTDKTPRYVATDAGRAIAYPEQETGDDLD